MEVLDLYSTRINDELTALEIEELTIMENAGREIAKRIIKEYSPCKVLIVCGAGGNGGDGYVVARYLLENGFKTTVFEASNNYKDITKINHQKYLGDYTEDITNDYDIIIDGLLGIGLETIIKKNYFEIIKKMNELNGIKISIDIASGINTDNGLSMGIYFKSNITFAVSFIKLGHILNDGKDSYDKIEVIDAKIKKFKSIGELTGYEIYDDMFLKRAKNSHKGTYKKATLIAGSYKYSGASYLADLALGELLVGSGYGQLLTPKSLFELYILKHPEIIVMPLSDENGEIKYNEDELQTILDSGSVGFGMGVGISENIYFILKYLLRNYRGNLLIDADALNSLSKYGINILENHLPNVVITPHIKEFARLINKDVRTVLENSYKLAIEFAKKYQLTVVLKSNTTIITNGHETYFNINGNPGLAKSGSGDVLSGIITGLLSYNTNISKTASLGCFILGEAADIVASKKNEYSIIPSDIIKEIPTVINKMVK